MRIDEHGEDTGRAGTHEMIMGQFYPRAFFFSLFSLERGDQANFTSDDVVSDEELVVMSRVW